MEKQLQPKLRFPEFSGDWKTSRLENLFEQFKSGNTITAKSIFESGTYPVFGGNGLRGYCENYTHDGKYFLIGRQGALCGNINKYNGKAFVSEHAIVCISNNDNDTEFLAQRLEYLNLNRLSESSAQPGLAVNKLLRLKITTPSLPEQQKIADYLTTIDKKIELLTEKKTELSRYKKAMMQKLFSQEIRFKDENGIDYPEWESVQLKDILLEHKEKNKNNKYSEVLSVAKHKGVINQIEHLGRSYSAEKIDHYKVINPFDIVYTKSPTSGFPFGIIKQNKLNRSGVLSPLYAVFRPKTKYLGMILHDLFSSEIETYNYLVPLVQKGAKNTMNINNDEFLKGKNYLLPTSELEQQKIADFLSAIDDNIAKVEEQIKETQNFKKSMLQQLFV